MAKSDYFNSEYQKIFDKALDAFHEGRWNDAIDLFEKASGQASFNGDLDSYNLKCFEEDCKDYIFECKGKLASEREKTIKTNRR